MGLGIRIRNNIRGGGGAFVLTQLSGCVLWLRADMGITKDGSDKVSAWADQSGNGIHFAQAVAGAQPTWFASQLNGMPAVRGDGATDIMVSEAALNLSAAAGLTIFYVAKDTAVGGQVAIENDVTQPTYFTSVPNNGGAGNLNLVVAGAAGARNNNFNGSGSDLASAAVCCFVLDSTLTGTGQSVCYVNGSSIARVGGSGVDCGTGYGNSLVYLFARLGVVAPWAGEFYEVAIFSRAFATAERQQVERHMGNHFGIAVA